LLKHITILGSALIGIDKTRDAIISYKKAAVLKPDFATTFNNLGIAYQRLGMIELALENYQIAIDILPGFASAHHNLSSVKTYHENDSQVLSDGIFIIQ
jgi:superkiller protein 3